MTTTTVQICQRKCLLFLSYDSDKQMLRKSMCRSQPQNPMWQKKKQRKHLPLLLCQYLILKILLSQRSPLSMNSGQPIKCLTHPEFLAIPKSHSSIFRLSCLSTCQTSLSTSCQRIPALDGIPRRMEKTFLKWSLRSLSWLWIRILHKSRW